MFKFIKSKQPKPENKKDLPERQYFSNKSLPQKSRLNQIGNAQNMKLPNLFKRLSVMNQTLKAKDLKIKKLETQVASQKFLVERYQEARKKEEARKNKNKNNKVESCHSILEYSQISQNQNQTQEDNKFATASTIFPTKRKAFIADPLNESHIVVIQELDESLSNYSNDSSILSNQNMSQSETPKPAPRRMKRQNCNGKLEITNCNHNTCDSSFIDDTNFTWFGVKKEN